jgi:hypothetical protein
MFEQNKKTEAAPMTTAAPVIDAKKAKKDAANKAAHDKRKAAITSLVDLANRLGTDDDKAKAAYLSGVARAGRVQVAGKDFLTILFQKTPGTSVDEGTVFKTTKMGRTEMRAFIKKMVQADHYVTFDAVAETYTYVGDTKPANWTGPNKAVAKLA